MAITVLDWWYQHVVGPMMIYLLVGLPAAALIGAGSSLLGWPIYPTPWVDAYLFTVAFALLVVGLTWFSQEIRTEESDDRGQAAVDPFWIPLLLAFIAVALLIVQDVVGAV